MRIRSQRWSSKFVAEVPEEVTEAAAAAPAPADSAAAFAALDQAFAVEAADDVAQGDEANVFDAEPGPTDGNGSAAVVALVVPLEVETAADPLASSTPEPANLTEWVRVSAGVTTAEEAADEAESAAAGTGSWFGRTTACVNAQDRLSYALQKVERLTVGEERPSYVTSAAGEETYAELGERLESARERGRAACGCRGETPGCVRTGGRAQLVDRIGGGGVRAGATGNIGGGRDAGGSSRAGSGRGLARGTGWCEAGRRQVEEYEQALFQNGAIVDSLVIRRGPSVVQRGRTIVIDLRHPAARYAVDTAVRFLQDARPGESVEYVEGLVDTHMTAEVHRLRAVESERGSMLSPVELNAGLMALGFAGNLRTYWAGCGEY